MNDLISRQAAIDALGEEPEVWTGKDEYAQGLNNQWHYDRNAILAVPPAEPERKKGRWLRYDIDGEPNEVDPFHWQCDQCLCTEHGRRSTPWRFCPNCGADMRGEADVKV